MVCGVRFRFLKSFAVLPRERLSMVSWSLHWCVSHQHQAPAAEQKAPSQTHTTSQLPATRKTHHLAHLGIQSDEMVVMDLLLVAVVVRELLH